MGKKDIIFLVLIAIVDIPIFILIGKLFFRDREGFKEAFGILFSLGFFSILFGGWDEYILDLWAGTKFAIFIILCFAIFLGQLVLVTKVFY